MTSLFQTLAGLRTYLGFIIHLIALVLLFVLGFWKGVDVTTAIPLVLMSYMGGRTFAQASAHWAASKDATADTESVIAAVNEK